jgi:alkylhydroperoxidase family enzyme
LSIGQDWAGLTTAERAMLGYARKLTMDSRSISEDDVAQVRRSDFSDIAILEVNMAAVYMNLVNRIAHGLGVELEPSLSLFTR